MMGISLKKNVVCIDSDPFFELWFWKGEKCEITQTDDFDFQKFKFAQS